jgi:hypothetical protein
MGKVPLISFISLFTLLSSTAATADHNVDLVEDDEAQSETRPSIEDSESGEDIMLITAARKPIASPQTITANEIRTSAIGNGNLSDVIKTSPAVQISNSDNSGNQQGEIKPAKVTIHGASSYQNNFILDGMSFNNDIDPSDPGLGITATRVESDEQGYYVDSRLVDTVNIYDSNIPVEFGNFTGGVVDVIARRWHRQNGGNVYYNTTRSSWNKTHVDPRVDFDTRHNTADRPSRFQPDYKKNGYGGWFEAGITDDLGILFSASRRESDISSYAYQGDSVELDSGNNIAYVSANGGFKNQTRESNNYSAKLSWYATENTDLDFSVNYSNYENYSFSSTVANSGFNTEHNGIGAMLQLNSHWQAGKLGLTAGYQELEDKRLNDLNYYLGVLDYSGAGSNKYAGGIGDLTTKQKNVSFKGQFDFTAIELGGVAHQPKVGVEYSQVRAKYVREQDYFRYNYIITGFWDYWSINAFEAGSHKAEFNNYSFFIDDTINYRRLTLRPGVRLDYDDFVQKANLAPRVTASYDLFGNGKTNIIAGYNRYYGRTMMVYALYGAQNAGLKICGFGCLPGDPIDDINWTNNTDFEGLDSLSTPYSDEFNIGAEQTVMNSLWEFKYVHRDGRDEVISRPKYSGSSVRTFDNSGQSTHDSFSIGVSNAEPWRLGVTNNSLKTSIVWEKNRSNSPKIGYAHYDAAGNSISRDRVYYDGRVINLADLPATDYNLPLRLNVELRTELPDYGLSFYNLFQWSGQRYQAVRYDSSYYTDPNSGEKMASYEREDFASTFRWDVKTYWQPKSLRGVNFSVEVNNITNKRNITDRYSYGTDSSGNAIILNSYDPGRQFWVQVGYDF